GEQERQRAVYEALKEGVPGVSQQSSMKDVADARQKLTTDKAGNLLGFYTDKLTQNSEDKKAVADNLSKLAQTQADPMTQRAALSATLADPTAVKGIPSEKLRQLNEVLNGKGDPAAVVK